MANLEISAQNVAFSVVTTATTAKEYIDECGFEDCVECANEFLAVLEEHGLVEFDDDFGDLEKLASGMYAANLFLAACAKIGRIETERLKDAETLEKSLRIS